MNKKKVIGIVGFIVLVIALIAAYLIFGPTPPAGSKEITIEVVNSKQETTAYDVSTDAEYLSQAMDEAEGLEYSGTEGDYGVMLTSVNGEQAIYEENNAYWSIMVNGAYGNYGIDQQPLADGDVYQLVYTKSE